MNWIGWTGWALVWVASVCAAVGLWHHRRGAARVARCAHELRGSLGTLRLGLDLALRRGGLSPQRVRALDLQLRRATLALADLTGGVAAGGTEAAERPEPIDVGEMVRDCVAGLQALAFSRHVRLSLDGAVDATVFGVRARMAQALSNLIANAIEHGASEVTVRVLTVPTSGTGRLARLRLEVQDDGPGLSRPLPELLRCRHSRREHGHGLAVAAALAEAHGGRLLSAPARRGARMVLELPTRGAESGQRSPLRRYR